MHVVRNIFVQFSKSSLTGGKVSITEMLYLQMAEAAGIQEELVSKAKQSRSEKKARKAMSKLGQGFSKFKYKPLLGHITNHICIFKKVLSNSLLIFFFMKIDF